MPRDKGPWTWEECLIDGITDGDTLDLRLTRDIGFHGFVAFIQRVRLNRIDAYKSTTETGRLGREYLFQLTSRVYLQVVTLKPYKYGDEWMAEITLPDGRNVSDLMVDRGLAVYWDGKGPRPAGVAWDETEWLHQ
jgi:endonuclease YncB( thermonuclease family)